MTRIKPFKAIVYNQQKAGDLAALVCPPYDIISPREQEYYHSLSPYNFIHLLLGKDISGEDKYQRAGTLFIDWLKNKVLVSDVNPAIYFYLQEYNLRGEKKIRLGLIGLLQLEDKNSTVFGHEHTHVEPKEDRLRLLESVEANLSPIFALFYDKKRIIQQIYQNHIQGKAPFIDIVNDEKIVHKLWRLDSPEALDTIQRSISDENIFIADGHHRYEVACAYRDQMKKKFKAMTGEEGFNYTLAYFTNAESKGLSILPVHRLVKLEAKAESESFMAGLKDYFDIEAVKDKIKFLFLLQKAGQTEHLLGMYKDKRFWLLRLKNINILDKTMPDKPKEYRSLDVCILNYIVLDKILGLDLEDKTSITFSTNEDELVEKVDNNPGYAAFFLNPVKVQQVMSVALSGNKMPAKSTYFYPKVLSGLVINKFNL